MIGTGRISRTLFAFALGAIATAGCGRRENPPPDVDAVSPAIVSAFVETPVVLTGRNFFVEAHADLDGGASIDRTWRVFVGATELDPADVTHVDLTRIDAIVPAGLAVGTYDVTVVAPSGASDTLPGALTIADGPQGLPITVEDAPGGAGIPIADRVLTADELLTAYAVARAANGAFIADVSATWSVSGGIGAVAPGPSNVAVLSADVVGVGALTASHPLAASAGVTGTLEVVPGRAAALDVSPASIDVTADDGAVAFSVSAVDADGNATTDLGTITWSTTVVSSVDQTGLFTPAAAGAGTVRATSSHGPSAEADAIVRPGRAATLVVAPDTLSVDADDVPAAFTVTGADADGNATTDLGAITWSTTGPITAIDPTTGVLDPVTAGTGAVRATSSYGASARSPGRRRS